MTVEAHSVRLDMPMAERLRQSFAQRTHHIPVVDDRRRLVGMISHPDMTAALYRQIAPANIGDRLAQAIACP